MPKALKQTTIVALFGLLVIGMAYFALLQIQGPSPLTLDRLRLGVTLTEARDAMPGRDWTTRVDTSGDVIVESEGVQLHFHEGMLVAAMLDLAASSPDAQGPSLEVTDFAVLRRSDRTSTSVHAELISRSCPTHQQLVAQILENAGESR